MIVGYNGSDFCGSQKNTGVRTVEEQIEKALFEIKAISHFNFGDLKKIAWNRATRTDKSVHALQNVFSCKVHLSREEKEANDGLEPFRERLNKALDKDAKFKSEIKVFCVIEVSNRFNSKINTSHREYSYFLPTFMLAKNDEFYLGKLGTDLQVEEKKVGEVQNVKVVNGITITRSLVDKVDRDDQINYMSRDISHLTSHP